MTRVAINGFGRIGRLVARAILERPDCGLELVSVNDLADAKANAWLFSRDSVHGKYPGKVTTDQTAFYVDLFKKVSQTAEFKDYLEKQALKPIFLTGTDMVKFLEEDDALNKNLMTEAGFVAH